MTNTQIPQIPGIPIMQNLIPAPGGGGIQTEPETINWAQWLQESNIQEQAIPQADYDAQIVAASEDKASNGKPMFRLTWQIIAGPYAGRRLQRTMTISHDSSKAMKVFFRQMRALGFDDNFWLANPSMAYVAEMMINRTARIQVKIREFPPNSGVFDNEVGFIREGIQTQPGTMPTMINTQGYPAAPQMPQMLAPQQPQYQQPPQQYAPPAQVQDQQPQQPQTYNAPMAGQSFPQQPQQPGQGMTQAPPIAPQQPAPQLPPAQYIPVGPEHAQAPVSAPPPQPVPAQQQQPAATYNVQQAAQGQNPWGQQQPTQAPPPPPQTPAFQDMLRPPQEAPQQATAAPPSPAPYQGQQAAPEAAQPQPAQPTQAQIDAFNAHLQAQQPQQPQQPAPQAPPLPREF